MNAKTNAPVILLVSALFSQTTAAAELTIPHTFVSGTPAVAAEVNANFVETKAEIDDNNSRIAINARDISETDNALMTHEGDVSAHHTRYTNAEAANAARSAIVQPAVKQTPSDTWADLSTTASSVQSLQVTPPANGKLLVTATGTISYYFTTGTSNGYLCVDLADQAAVVDGCSPNVGSKSAFRSAIPTNFPSISGIGMGSAFSLSEVFDATAGTSKTFHINGRVTGVDLASILHPTITVVFIPNALP